MILLKKTVFDKLVAKVNSIDTSEVILKTKYDRDQPKIENKISNTSGLVKKTDYNAKITKIEGKIPRISGFGTNAAGLSENAALTTVEYKMPNINSLVKKTDYNTKITETEKKLTGHNHDKSITTPEFNSLAHDLFNARFAQVNLITKRGYDAKWHVL